MFLNVLSKEELAYIAGVFDGEGSILCKNGKVTFAITQGEKGIELLYFIKRALGRGNINLHQKPRSEKHQVVYRYRLQSSKLSIYLLNKLMPYLIVKKAIVKQIIEQKKDLL